MAPTTDPFATAPRISNLSLNTKSKSTIPAKSSVLASHTHVTLRFCVTAKTIYGQSVLLSADSASFGEYNPHAATSLSFEHPGVWTVDLVRPVKTSTFRYKYLLRENDNIVWESGSERVLTLSDFSRSGSVLVRDSWRSKPDVVRDIFSTSAFTDVIFGNRNRAQVLQNQFQKPLTPSASNPNDLPREAIDVRFAVFVSRVQRGDEVYIIGDCKQLGSYDISKAVPLRDYSAPQWSTTISLPVSVRKVTYRFIIRRDGALIVKDMLERVLELNNEDTHFLKRKRKDTAPTVLAPSEMSFEFPTKWKGAGIALPVFSIRSRKSCGVGEFNDLKMVVDFCKKAGYQLLQLLPVNDTTANHTYKDSYPYSAVSSFALHPQFINIESLGDLPSPLLKEYNVEKERLNSFSKVDYVQVMKAKKRFIEEMYKIQRSDVLESEEFLSWFEDHQGWLVPYALFRFFMEINGSPNYDQWGARSSVTIEEMKRLSAPDTFHFDYLGLTYYTQFHLHKQLKEASEYAADRQVVFKGDLPIGVNRYCADTWVNPHLFRLHMQAGAPPDFFSKYGQNWFFPTYNWDAMKQNNYEWWRCRLGHMSNYFHAYRIDHILGFFRIWEIPESCRTGMAGRFYPAHGITRQELESRGLWDVERYIRPYIRDGFLQEMFEDEWWKIKERFFEPYYDRLHFKDKYNTEKKMEKALELPKDSPERERKYNDYVLKQMFSLFNNVCLLQDIEDPNIVHPRFMLHETTSYMELPSNEWKEALRSLHDDYMYRRQDELWKKNGLQRLPMMKAASQMLVCGEDLGMIPKCVPSVMKETSIVSLAVQRMPAGDIEFGIPAEYKYECVATTSSHDTSTFRGWWEELSAEERMRYWRQVKKQSGDSPPPAECQPEICEWAVKDHLASPAMWAIFPLQDLLGIDAKIRRRNAAEEQINCPSDPNHVWCFRLHTDIENLVENEKFVQRLAKLNEEARRGVTY